VKAIEGPAAGGAAINEHRGPVAAVDAEMIAGPASRAGQAVWLAIAGFLVHEICER